MILSVLLSACLTYEAPPPPPPPPGAKEREELSLVPPGAEPDGEVPNVPPRITRIRLEPVRPTTRDPVRAFVEWEDADDERVDVDYIWILNGQERPDLSLEILAADRHKKGDELAVKVTVSDGEGESTESSAPVTVVNTAPEFEGDPRVAGQVDGLTLKGTDPDVDDRLTFSMSGQPKGMTIHPERGRIEYKGSEEEEGGAYQITVTLTDNDGGSAQWNFGIEISPGSVAAERQKLEAEKAQDAIDG